MTTDDQQAAGLLFHLQCSPLAASICGDLEQTRFVVPPPLSLDAPAQRPRAHSLMPWDSDAAGTLCALMSAPKSASRKRSMSMDAMTRKRGMSMDASISNTTTTTRKRGMSMDASISNNTTTTTRKRGMSVDAGSHSRSLSIMTTRKRGMSMDSSVLDLEGLEDFDVESSATTPAISDEEGPFVGRYTLEERKRIIQRFCEKRNRRIWRKRIKYDVRKNFADSRLRVKGRFVRKEDEEQLRDLFKMTF